MSDNRFGLVLTLLLSLLSLPLRAEFSSWDNNADIARSRWQFSLGAGWSIPLNIKGILPATNNTVITSDTGWRERATSQEKEGDVGQSTSYEGSLFYSVFPWLSLGAFGGVVGPHQIRFTQQEVGLTIQEYDSDEFLGTLINPATLRYSLTLSRAVTLVRIGEWTGAGRLRLRTYLIAGGGWYMVDQSADIEYVAFGDPVLFRRRYYDRSDQYAGVLAGLGLSIAIGESGSASLEGRYERVFNPGTPLRFFTPSVELGYHFGN